MGKKGLKWRSYQSLFTFFCNDVRKKRQIISSSFSTNLHAKSWLNKLRNNPLPLHFHPNLVPFHLYLVLFPSLFPSQSSQVHISLLLIKNLSVTFNKRIRTFFSNFCNACSSYLWFHIFHPPFVSLVSSHFSVFLFWDLSSITISCLYQVIGEMAPVTVLR